VKPNPHLPRQRYDYSRAVRLKHLLRDDFLAELDFGRTLCKQRRRKLANAIFLEFIRLAMDAVMEENAKVLFPTTPALLLYIRQKAPQDLYYSILQPNIYTDVSLFRSDGKIYEYALYNQAMKRVLPVRCGYGRYKNLVARVNNGQRYRER
jgi:hypothetical protein